MIAFRLHNLQQHTSKEARREKNKPGNPKYQCPYCLKLTACLKQHCKKKHPEKLAVTGRKTRYNITKPKVSGKKSRIRKLVNCPSCGVAQTDWRKHMRLMHGATDSDLVAIANKKKAKSSSAAEKLCEFSDDVQKLLSKYFHSRYQSKSKDLTYEVLLS
jgi:hypothetical protein